MKIYFIFSVVRAFTGDPIRNLEDASLESGPRVKFTAHRVGTLDTFFNEHPGLRDGLQDTLKQLAEALTEMEVSGGAPVLADGKVGGNGALRLQLTSNDEVMVITKSGKLANQVLDLNTDICIVRSFDMDTWSAEYFAKEDSILPSSDTPLHHASLNAHKKCGWTDPPNIILHGHGLATEEEAKRLNLPISTTETLFSTPEDTQALLELFKAHPYPSSKVFIRKGHGFVILASSVGEGVDIMNNIMG